MDHQDPSKRTEKDKRFEVQYNPQLFAILAEQLLTKNHVTILYGSYAVGVSKKDDKIDAVIIENKSGRQAITAKSVVDATGDCDIAFLAHAPTEKFKQGNILAAWYYSLGRNGYKLNILGFSDIPDDQKNGKNTVPLLSEKRFSGLRGYELSEMTQLSHSSVFNDFVKKRIHDPSVVPTSIAMIPQIRMTRKLVGEYTLHDTQAHTFFDDSIGMVSDWRKRGPVYEVPFGTIYSKTVKNLIVAGRCTSVTDSMWDIMRVIPCCVVTGQAAGTAAAVSNDFSTLDVKSLQDILIHDGVVLHEKNLTS